MNRLKGHIEAVTVNGSMSLVEINLGTDLMLKSIVIDTPATAAYLKKGTELNLLFKETELIIAKDKALDISIENRILATIVKIESGTMLCKLHLTTGAGNMVAVISANAARQLQLKESDKVIAMIKLNEIMLSEC